MTRSKSHNDQFSADRSFPYVLVCSMLGSIVSLASVCSSPFTQSPR